MYIALKFYFCYNLDEYKIEGYGDIMKNKFYKILFSFLFLIVFMPTVDAGLHVGTCTKIPGTEGQGPDGGTLWNCPEMTYDGVPVHCVEPAAWAIEGDVCTPHQTDNLATCIDACDATPSIKVTPAAEKLTLSSDGKYYITGNFTVAVSVPNGTKNYTPTFTGTVPTGAQIIDASDNVVTGKSTSATKLRVRVPIASITGKVNFGIAFTYDYKYTKTYRATYNYYYSCPGQDVKTNDVTTQNVTEQVGGTAKASVTVNISLGNLQIIKVDATDNTKLANVEFKLYLDAACTKEATTASGQAIKIVTDQNGYAEVNNLVYGTYYLKETKGQSTYQVLVSPTKVSIDQDVVKITIANKPIDIYISKKDITGADELAGALIRITDATGDKVIKEFYSTNEPTKIRFEKGTYILTEIIAPKGYTKVENSLTFQVDENGKIKITKINDQEYKYTDDTITILNDISKVVISKQDITSTKELKGAKLTVKCDNGFTETWVSEDAPRKLDIARNATCTLTEEIAPEGYDKVTTSLKFKVKADGDVEVIGVLDGSYYVDGNKIVVYNGVTIIPVPDTGAFVWIGTILIGSGLVFIGYKFITDKKAPKETIEKETKEEPKKKTKKAKKDETKN